MKVLFVIPDLHYGGAARQLTLLAAGLPAERWERRVCVLGEVGPWAERLTGEGIAVEALRWQRWLDFRPWQRLRSLVKTFQPDVIHAWCLASVRALAPALFRRSIRLIVSRPLPVGARRAVLSRLDRWLLGRADHLVVFGPAEAEGCRSTGLPADRLVEIPPGVQPIADCRLQIADCSEKSAIYNLQSVITCVGPLEPHKGFHDALWAINILRYAAADVYLRIAGKGSDSGRLAAFVRTVCLNNHVHLLGEQEDVTNLLKQAQMVWVPSQTSGGINVLLEAMAAGKPVVASALPELAEIVRDGETGLLFPPGDAAALARQTRRLLDDGECRRLLGEAGQRRAAACFPVSAMVEAFVRLYHDG